MHVLPSWFPGVAFVACLAFAVVSLRLRPYWRDFYRVRLPWPLRCVTCVRRRRLAHCCFCRFERA